MSISGLVEQYGYLAVFIGTFLEGETVLLFVGFAAHRGLLNLPDVMLVALVASTLGDQLYFFLGRRHGAKLLGKFPSLQKQVPRVEALLEKYHSPLILGVRFLYGLRVAGPVIMGALHVSPLRFVMLNLIGAALWAMLIAGLGYHFGTLLETIMHDLKRFEEVILVLILVSGLAWTLFRHFRRKPGGR